MKIKLTQYESDKIKELEQKKKVQVEKISARIDRIKTRRMAKMRTINNRRKYLLGIATLAKIHSGEWTKEEVIHVLNLDKLLSGNRDRAIFGMPPRSQSKD